MISTNKTRFIVDIDELRTHSRDRADKLVKVYREQEIFLKSLHDVLKTTNLEYYKLNEHNFCIGFTGNLKRYSPRDIPYEFDNLVCVVGICIELGISSVSLEKSVHHCPAKNSFRYTTYDSKTLYKYIPTRDYDGDILVRDKLNL